VPRPDLKVFFTFVKKSPQDVTSSDVLDFVADLQAPKPCRENVVRFPDASPVSPPRPCADTLPLAPPFCGYLLATEVTVGAPAT
jgi:hypothetical protein